MFDNQKFQSVERSKKSPKTLEASRAFPVLKFSCQTILLILVFSLLFKVASQQYLGRVWISVEIGSWRDIFALLLSAQSLGSDSFV